MKYKAIEKLDNEFKGYKGNGFANVILESTVNAVKSFCENARFAEAVVNQTKTIGEFCEEIVKPLEKKQSDTKTRSRGEGLSDIDVYKKVVAFYIPGADITFSMDVVLPENTNKSDKIIKLSLENYI